MARESMPEPYILTVAGQTIYHDAPETTPHRYKGRVRVMRERDWPQGPYLAVVPAGWTFAQIEAIVKEVLPHVEP